ncbi:MAG TPA: S1C family serine protease [Solirubrobacteraceae bacterium]|nr:S1C family serine protease [Solirubrobacteraceae bacterium]
MNFLDELEAAVTAVAGRVGPAVVGLGRGWGRGSGVVVAEGRVLTNAHVLRGEEVAVTRADGEVALGRVAGTDAALDVAVIAVDTGAAQAVAWEPAALEQLAAGRPVFALADPGGRGLRTSFGLVTATGRSFRGPQGRRIRGSIEHSAPLPRGSSGGPLVDAGGRLLGINSVRMEGGLLLALPADAALRATVDALGRGELPARPRLGLALAPPRAARQMRAAVGLPERDGLLVRGVEPGSPSERAGLKQGDLLVATGSRALHGYDDLFDALDEAQGSITFTVVRGAEERQVETHFSL